MYLQDAVFEPEEAVDQGPLQSRLRQSLLDRPAAQIEAPRRGLGAAAAAAVAPRRRRPAGRRAPPQPAAAPRDLLQVAHLRGKPDDEGIPREDEKEN